MTHPWREHIKLTKENNPTIKNFGEIIKLAKKTYTKKSSKKTQKKGNSDKSKKKTLKSSNSEGNIVSDDKIIQTPSSVLRKASTVIVSTIKQDGGSKIKADRIDKYGTSRRYRAIEEGDCQFPFKYNNKTYDEEEGCADSKDGKWCATKVNVKTLKPEKWGYCETHLKSQEEGDPPPVLTSSSEEDNEEGEFVAHMIT